MTIAEEIKKVASTKAGLASLILPPLIGYGVIAVANDYKSNSKKPRDLPPIQLEQDDFKTLELNTMLQWAALTYSYATLRNIVRDNKEHKFIKPELVVTQHLPDDTNPFRGTHLKKTVNATNILEFLKLNQSHLVGDEGGLEFNPEGDGKADQDGDGESDLKMMQRLEQVDDEFDADIIEFDDEFVGEGLDSELVFSIVLNRTEKRVTVCFRGSVSLKDWVVDLSGTKRKPAIIKEFADDTGTETHTGFSGYLFGDTHHEGDGKSKFEQIVHILKQVNKKHPGFKIYVTGHSLGGALTQLLAFALAGSKLTEDLPKPIVAISYASPRVGNRGYLQKYQQLEKAGKLRHIRVSNQGDVVTVAPSGGFYQTGLNLHVAPGKQVEIAYSKDRSFWSQVNVNALGNHGLATYHKRLFIERNLTDISSNVEELYQKYVN